MKKIIVMSLFFLGLQTLALEVGDLVPAGLQTNHLFSNGTEATQDILSHTQSEHKFTVLEFFQTTCSACIENRPAFINLGERFSAVATFKYVGLDRKEKALRDFYTLIKGEFDFPYVLDHLRVVTKAFGIVATPTSFIVNQQGQIVFKHEGTFEAGDLQAIQEILK